MILYVYSIGKIIYVKILMSTWKRCEDMEKSKKNAIILSVVAIATFAILVIGATYAYFQATGGTGASSNLNVITATTD